MTIAEALRAAANHVEDHAEITAWDLHRQPTEEQQVVKAEKVRVVARAMHALADEAETRVVRYAEFETLKDRLYALGFALTPKLVENVATAFRDAKGPVTAPAKGWLSRP